MIKNKKTFVLFALINTICAEKNITTFISPRSQSTNAARELAGWENKVNIFTNKDFYGALALTPEVMHSFKSDRIAQCFFGDTVLACKSAFFTVSGSRTNNRTSTDWLADYFGLPTDFISCIEMEPIISNALFDVNIYLGLNRLFSGLYFRIHAPLVYTRWNLAISEKIVQRGTNDHDPGYFNATGIARNQLVPSFISFISGNQTPHADGLIFLPLENAKMHPCSLKKVGLSEIQAALGLNPLQNDWCHIGFNIRLSAPTGNRPKGEFLFEPIVGNGHHWELGAGFSAHVLAWHREETQEEVGVYCDANVTHLFSTTQCRSFDLKEKNNSRYMLATLVGTPVKNNIRGQTPGITTSPIAQYQNVVAPIANITTIAVNVSAPIQIDLALMLAYTQSRHSFVFGYGFWARSCETIALCEKTLLDQTLWTIKGDAQVIGFEDSLGNPPTALSASQSKATIESGKNFRRQGSTSAADIAQGKQNPRIDNPQLAISDSNNDTIFDPVRTSPGGADQINTSIQPNVLACKDIDLHSASTKGIAHKLFAQVTHTWLEKTGVVPYLGLGAEVELGKHASCAPGNQKPSCIDCAISFWGLWAKGGISY